MPDQGWSVTVSFTEDGDRTRADAILELASHRFHGFGQAQRAARSERPSNRARPGRSARSPTSCQHQKSARQRCRRQREAATMATPRSLLIAAALGQHRPPVDRPRFGRHVLAVVVLVVVSASLLCDYRSERPHAPFSSLTSLWRGLSEQ
jgi:hypothetical protein